MDDTTSTSATVIENESALPPALWARQEEEVVHCIRAHFANLRETYAAAKAGDIEDVDLHGVAGRGAIDQLNMILAMAGGATTHACIQARQPKPGSTEREIYDARCRTVELRLNDVLRDLDGVSMALRSALASFFGGPSPMSEASLEELQGAMREFMKGLPHFAEGLQLWHDAARNLPETKKAPKTKKK